MESLQHNSLSFELIKESKNEVVSQISKLISTIEECTSTERVIEENKRDEWVKLLNDEKRKVEDLRYTIAVVGTMKAGKSTTINAITGIEVLPNRSMAMTVLPTVITHKQNQKIPVLEFSKTKPFNDAIASIKNRLKELDKNIKYEINYDLDKTLDKIRDGRLSRAKNIYEGQNGIYEFMESINDIVRVCKHADFDISSPIDEYTSLDEFPQIYVEFTYFADQQTESIGKLSLVDTPGYNEAGQGHLRSVVKEQLKNASAILCILNFTQLNTMDEENLRDWINEIKRASNTELFVLVNRYDERDKAKDMNRIKTKEYVDKHLFGDYSIEDKIFPVSAKWGFLSNCVLRQLSMHNVLPHPSKEPWVNDFCEKVFGEEWEQSLEEEEDLSKYLKDIDNLIKGARRHWVNSYLQEPIENIINFSLQNVVPLTLRSGLDEIKARAQEIQTSLNIKQVLLKEDIGKIYDSIDKLDRQINTLKKAQKECIGFKKEALEEVGDILRSSIQSVKNTAAIDVKKLAKEALKQNQEQEREKLSSQVPERYDNMSFFPKLLSALLNTKFQESSYFEKLNKVFSGDENIEFKNKATASRFINRIGSEVGEKVERAFNEMVNSLNKPINESQDRLSHNINEKISPIINSLKKDMKEKFKIEITMPGIEFPKLVFDMDDMKRELVILEKEEVVYSVKREKKEVLGRTKRFFADMLYKDWGYEYVDEIEIEERYVVNPVQVRNKILQNIGMMADNIESDVNKYLDLVFEKNLGFFFNNIDKVFNDILADFITAKNLRNNIKERQTEIIDFIDIQLDKTFTILNKQEKHRGFLNEQFKSD